MLFLEGKKQLLSTNGKDVEDRNINYPLFEHDKPNLSAKLFLSH